MNKKSPRKKRADNTRVALIASLALNLILVLFLIVPTLAIQFMPGNNIDMALYNYSQTKLCSDNYDMHASNMADEQKKVFTALTCGRDYKTGEELDFKPIIDQVGK